MSTLSHAEDGGIFDNTHACVHTTVDLEIFAIKIFHQLLRRRKLNAQKQNTHYIAEPSGGEIFLMRKFNARSIFTAKISRSTVCQ